MISNQDILDIQNKIRSYSELDYDRLGAVYTPIEIVEFMVNASFDFIKKYFEIPISQFKIIDPCTGLGLFPLEMLKNSDVSRDQIIAYEINPETIKYAGIDFIQCLDTLEAPVRIPDSLFNVDTEKETILVIGNPPYNANQKSENDNNKNKDYPYIDNRIKETYIRESTAQKTKQYDMYKRFIRWSSDHIKDSGMISFITNNAYLDSKQDDGFRKCLQKEFDYVYIVDLKGNVRKNDKREGDSVFDIMVGTAIMFLVKDERIENKKAEIYYTSVEDYATKEQKFIFLKQNIVI